MSINFNSSASVGQSGSFDQRMQLLEKRHQKDEVWLGGSSSLFGYCVTQGINTDNVLTRIEDNMGYSEGSLSWGRSIVNNDNDSAVLFQDSNGSFAEVNFSKNLFEIKSEQQITSSICDWSKGRPYDGYSLTQAGFTFYQLFNSGSGDNKQHSIFLDRIDLDNFRWGLTSFIQMETGQ